MKQVFKIDNNRLYIEPVIVEDNQTLDINLIETKIPEGFYHPKWSGIEWIEGLTQEQIQEILNAPAPKNEMEILKEENAQLNLSVIELYEMLLG